VLTNEAEGGGHVTGIPKVIEAYNLHKDNAEVVESVATLIMELAEYGKSVINHFSPTELTGMLQRLRLGPYHSRYLVLKGLKDLKEG